MYRASDRAALGWSLGLDYNSATRFFTYFYVEYATARRDIQHFPDFALPTIDRGWSGHREHIWRKSGHAAGGLGPVGAFSRILSDRLA